MKLTVAACSFEIDKAKYGRIQLLPYGKFRATDGRPTDVEAWYVTDTNGADVVALANNQRNPLPIDYEHQIIHSLKNGKEAPSAGWMEYFYFTPQGIFADVRWTDKAADYIKNGEYRYISAVFAYDTDGYIRKIFHAALTNTPALDGMEEAMVAASVNLLQEDNPMDKKLLAALCALFALKADASEADITEKVTALSAAKGDSPVDVLDVYAKLAEKEQSVAALSTQVGNPDPAKFVPVEQVAALQADFNALKTSVEADKKAALITAALSQGKLAPALKDWAQSLSVEALSAYLEKAPAMAALSGKPQAKGDPEQKVVALSAAESAAAKALGLSEKDYMATYKEQK
ncbi:phage protease [Haemophilus influenzae]|uniref:Mu-like prophage I protein n=1 Tax=Haemophilus influenzae TaxID=727 RepID=A0ABD6WTK0_HAEIF|nr:phage protease [Haemophilus influenzae]EEP48195.1 putative I protein [Haemophilus influenzae 6P18H1]PRI81777.1 Mu-like prophage I protein [Haemophilus influenzae]PRK93924.1 Mu-like prophage I protein [Haemophilus influenzae]PRK95865.1 Mu-like prophage I protein [Haemophilus influenzae]PRM17537.1 Mu-like prophage I protein [Haemophilus influenzae]